MKILTISQYYFPEPFRITDICEEFIKLGHDVTVITSIPNYPIGKIYKGYRDAKKRDELINGVRVHRCFTIGRKHGVLFRFINYYSYVISSTQYIKSLKNEYDVVFVNQLSPVMMAHAGIEYKKKHNKKLLMYCLDLWPESLVAGGITRGSAIYKFYHKVSNKIYNQADKILVSSKSFTKYFEEQFGIINSEYLPQYAEEIFTPEICKKESDGYLDLMFAGNIGVTQSLETILKAVTLTQSIQNLRWHIVGEGSQLDQLKKKTKRFGNIYFYGRVPLEEMPKYYKMADVMLITMQKDPILSLTLPGKVQTYMAAGKPIIGAIDGETQRVIQDADCGYCCGAEDAESLAELVLKIDDREKLARYARNSYEYYRSYFLKNGFMNRIEGYLKSYSKQVL